MTPPRCIGIVYRDDAFARAAMGDDRFGDEEIFTLDSSTRNQKLIAAIYRAGDSGNWETV